MSDNSTAPHERPTPAESEYLIQLYLLIREGRKVVGARIAEHMGVSAPAVTQALKRMARHGLIRSSRDEGVKLTDTGIESAKRTIRRHYLLERLLVDELGYDWVDADDEAARLEYSLSPSLEEHLFERLGRPTTCPHGNPFPDSAEEQQLLHARAVSELAVGETARILRVTEYGEADGELMRFLHDNGLVPGATITLAGATDRNLTIERDGEPVELAMDKSRYLRVDG